MKIFGVVSTGLVVVSLLLASLLLWVGRQQTESVSSKRVAFQLSSQRQRRDATMRPSSGYGDYPTTSPPPAATEKSTNERRERLFSGKILGWIFDTLGKLFSPPESEPSPTPPSRAPPRAQPRASPVLSPAAKCAQLPSRVPPLPGKKGAAFTLRDLGQPGDWLENMPKVVLLKPYWNYSWGARHMSAQPDDIEFVPMIWGGNDAEVMYKTIRDTIIPQIKSGKTKRVLAFNEPDSDSQANMAVATALQRWPLLETTNVPLTSPSCIHPDNAWMTSFMADVKRNCRRVDWVGVHWYGDANFDEFVVYLREAYDLHKRPLLLTEFAPADFGASTVEENKNSPAEVLAFMKRALPWLEAQPWIAGYAWFAFGATSPVGYSSALWNEEGQMLPTGRFYASVRTDRPSGDQSIDPDR
jgi:Glycosyl hydrolase catalytic core